MDRKRNIWLIIFLALALPYPAMSQSDPMVCKFWRPTYLMGAVRLGGHYRYEEGTSNEIYNYQKNPMFYGGLLFNSTSYFWHPNFMTVDLGAEYNPIKSQEDFLTVPDESEVRTIKKVDFTATFFRQKAVNLSLYANMNESYTNRENLSDYKINSTNFGGSFSWSNKALPVQVRYQDGKWREQEIQTGRVFNNHQSFLQADFNKSFSSRDRNELRYAHNTFYRQDAELPATSNVSDNIELIDRIYFDNREHYALQSHITGIDQRGDDAYSRIQVNEGLHFNLPANLTLTGNYDFFSTKRISQVTNQNNISGMLGYRLYQSLFANISYEDNLTKNTFYSEDNNKLGLDLRYVKKIPANGQISLSFMSYRQHQKRVSDITALQVYNEEHTLTDGSIELLDNPNVYENTVIVTDGTGTIIYQPNFDYILIKRSAFLEIQRVPGGQIPNNSAIYVDYTFMPPGSYQFNAIYRQFSADLMLVGNLIDVYFRLAKQDYNNLESTELVTLNYFNQQVIGARLEYRFASGGVEYEAYNSTIVPYHSVRYFINLQGTLKSRIVFAFNGNVRNYRMLDQNTNQNYYDAAANIGYNFNAYTRITFEGTYRKQLGQGIDLDLLTGKIEFQATFRQVFIRAGVQVYRRIYLGEQTNFVGGFFEIVRSFSWNRKYNCVR